MHHRCILSFREFYLEPRLEDLIRQLQILDVVVKNVFLTPRGFRCL